jgi:hypothetical protein
MKSWKWKILTPIILLSLLAATKYILWDFPVSNGKRVGNLTKISKKGKVLPTWEGTIDEGSGDKLTSFFSVSNTEVAEELYNYEGKQVIIYYEQYILGWPRDTNYNVISWKPKDSNGLNSAEVSAIQNKSLSLLSKTLFCSLLGSLYSNSELYTQVKSHLKENNLYLFKQVASCN